LENNLLWEWFLSNVWKIESNFFLYRDTNNSYVLEFAHRVKLVYRLYKIFGRRILFLTCIHRCMVNFFNQNLEGVYLHSYTKKLLVLLILLVEWTSHLDNVWLLLSTRSPKVPIDTSKKSVNSFKKFPIHLLS